jgi:hypothetical protein
LPKPPAPSGSGQPRGRALLLLLARLPRPAVLLLTLGLVVAGLFLPGIPGAVLLLVVGLLLAWLLGVAWPVLAPAARVPRVLTVALVLGYALWKTTAGH